MPVIRSFENATPQLHPASYLAETAAVVADALRRNEGIVELDARGVVASLSLSPIYLPDVAGTGRAQLWPHRHGTDAMSISLLQRA